jgi:putative hydrolase of the HAD superfamily
MPPTILPINWQPIRHVILDFGGVLYRIDHRATAAAFHRLGFERFESLYDHGSQSGLMDDLECGTASEEEFLLALRNRCREGTSIEDVKDAWNAVLTGLRPEVLPLLKKLASRFDLLLFSNTNALHVEFFERQIMRDHGKAFGQMFRQIIYSHRLGYRKPHPAAFREVERRFGVSPEATLFIDDTKINVLGATQAGWTATHHEPDRIPLAGLLHQLGLDDS